MKRRIRTGLCLLACAMLVGCGTSNEDSGISQSETPIPQGTVSEKTLDTSVLNTDISTFAVEDNVRIVGLGEACHGVGEYQIMKAEVFKSLVNNNGCRTFVIEGDFGGSLAVEEYIHGGEGTAQEAVESIGFAIYCTGEMTELAEWMRTYNETAGEDEDLHFYGMDMQRVDNNKAYVLDYLQRVDNGLSSQYEEILRSYTDDNRIYLTKDEAEVCQNAAEELTDEFDSHKAEWSTSTGEKEYILARECANTIRECMVVSQSGMDYNQIRDSFMAQKVELIMGLTGEDVIFVNGHNGHIGRKAVYGYTNLGSILAEKYLDGYYAVGTDAAVTIFNSQTDDGFEKVSVSNSNELTSLTAAVDTGMYYLDFADIASDNEVYDIIDSSQKMTVINVSLSKLQRTMASSYTKKMVPADNYDGVIIYEQVTPSHVF